MEYNSCVKRLRPIWILAGMGALALGAWDLAVFTLEQCALAAIVQRTEALEAEYESRDYTRPVLRGSPQPGNAWDHYLRAIREINAEDKFSNDYVHLLSDFIHRPEKADRAGVAGVLAKHDSILEHLRRGVRCGEARFAYDWMMKGGRETEPSDEEQALRLLSISKARWLREQRHYREAAELLLDMCLFCRDRNQVDTRTDRGSSEAMLDELHAILVSGELSATDLQRVDRELAILVQVSPDRTFALRNNVLARGMYLRMEARERRQMRWCSSDGVDLVATWRDLHSNQLMNAHAFRMLDRWTDRLVAAEGMNWTDALLEQRAVKAEIEMERKGFELLSDVSVWGAGFRRHGSAKLRILHVAAHYLVTGQVLEVRDPYDDGPLKTVRGAKLKIWSVGRDGIDNEGRGSWRGFWGEDLVIVLDPPPTERW